MGDNFQGLTVIDTNFDPGTPEYQLGVGVVLFGGTREIYDVIGPLYFHHYFLYWKVWCIKIIVGCTNFGFKAHLIIQATQTHVINQRLQNKIMVQVVVIILLLAIPIAPVLAIG